MNDNLFKLIIALIPLLGTLITGFLIPWIKIQIGNEKLATYTEWAEKAVRCAQQIYTPEQWQEKKEYCMDFMTDLCNGALTRNQIDVLIEAAVKELKLAEKAVEGN